MSEKPNIRIKTFAREIKTNTEWGQADRSIEKLCNGDIEYLIGLMENFKEVFGLNMRDQFYLTELQCILRNRSEQQ